MLELRWESKLVGSRLDHVKPPGKGFLAGEGRLKEWRPSPAVSLEGIGEE